MDIFDIASKMLSIIILFIAGYLMRKSGFLKVDTIADLKKLIINVSLPSLIFLSFSKTEVHLDHLVIIVTVFFACVFMLLVGYALKKVLKIESTYFPLLLSGFEAGMLGYSIFALFFGKDQIIKFAIVDLGQVIFVFFILASILIKHRDGNENMPVHFSAFFKNPIILAIILGVLVNKIGVSTWLYETSLTNSLLQTLELIGNVTTPLICIVIGYELIFERTHLKMIGMAIVIRMSFWAFIGYLISEVLVKKVLNLGSEYQAAIYMMFVLPPPFVIPIFMREGEKDKNFVNNVLSIHTMLTLAAMVFISYFYL